VGGVKCGGVNWGVGGGRLRVAGGGGGGTGGWGGYSRSGLAGVKVIRSVENSPA